MTTPHRPLRLWPGVAAAILLLVVGFGAPLVVPGGSLYGLIGGLVLGLVILLWWLFFSRAPWIERVGAIALTAVVLMATRPWLHISLATAGQSRLFFVLAVPMLMVALAAGAYAGRRASSGRRLVSIGVAISVASAGFLLLRTDGVFGGSSQLQWRWSPTAEERLLAQSADEPLPVPLAPPAAAAGAAASVTPAPVTLPVTNAAVAAPSAPPAAIPVPWPGFRGPSRDGVVRNTRIATDWSVTPPVEVWRRPIGPGWSSFAVRGDLLYTQEQRGDDEIVASYRVSTGAPVWRHRDATRFWESNGGPGPRGTPTVQGNRVYAFGATGILNVLDADTGALIWSRNVATDSGTNVPMWGFSSSPLIIEDRVIVAASSKLVAYALDGGAPLWIGQPRRGSYSSPHRMEIDGVAQVVLLSSAGTTSVAPSDGAVLWEHAWGEATVIVQPAVIGNGELLTNAIAATGGLGLRRLSITRASGTWAVTERWTSNGLKPYFNDFVVHRGHAYGFDGAILSCVNVEDGTRVWKGGRYGNGQLILLADQDLLLVVSEEGELALVSATPGGYKEIAKVPALDGKTWNHPVLVGDTLLVRNGEEMAAFRLASKR